MDPTTALWAIRGREHVHVWREDIKAHYCLACQDHADFCPVDPIDRASSVSRLHYIETGHYLDTMGNCECDE